MIAAKDFISALHEQWEVEKEYDNNNIYHLFYSVNYYGYIKEGNLRSVFREYRKR